VCRTVETAMLAFGKAEKTPGSARRPVQTDDPTRYDPLRKLLSTPPVPGTNNVVSSHGNPYFAVFGAPYLAEGEIAVVRPAAKRTSKLSRASASATGRRWRPKATKRSIHLAPESFTIIVTD